jgi:hypothetical protein
MPSRKKLEELIASIDKANAAIATFARIEEELRVIRNGMPDDRGKSRLTDMIRTNVEIVELTKQRLERATNELRTIEKQRRAPGDANGLRTRAMVVDLTRPQ